MDVFPDLDSKLLKDPEASHPVQFRCPCSRERSVSALMLVGRDELIDMLEKDGGAELTCQFCNTRYRVSGDELKALIAELAPAT